MKKQTQRRRVSGILAHITSLPSPYGIGDLGEESRKFMDYLKSAGQTIWQILPLGPTDPAFAHSPYMSPSAFAGNPLLISPQLLIADGLLTAADLPDASFSPYLVDFQQVAGLKKTILQRAYLKFDKKEPKFLEFTKLTDWLADYALFMVLKEKFPGKAWNQWQQDIARRDVATLKKLRVTLRKEIGYYLFEQFVFHCQWTDLHASAQQAGMKIFGDIPIYVSHDSADVWANQQIFQLETTGEPSRVAGVPPDYFSDTGQKWGNPLYRWNSEDKAISDKLLDWWTLRFKAIFSRVDIARIDHFRGFESYWSVGGQEKTAENGNWEQGPGVPFFKEIFKRLGKLDIIAEDLGDITEAVLKLRDKLGFPGMRVLQFAFDGNQDNTFLPCNYETHNTVVYTGTHDNDTTVGWFLSDKLNDTLRKQIKQYANRELHDQTAIHADLIYLALSSVADMAIIPLQDALGFGSDCRMNTPGTSEGNWIWRCSDEFLTMDVANWLSELTQRFGRSPKVMDS